MQERRKADALRENRDYSSVFADDAESSPSTKEQTGNKPGRSNISKHLLALLVYKYSKECSRFHQF
jgi:hypothetical protein